VLAARALGPTDFGLIAVLWAAMFLAVVVLFRPLEQTTSRAVADRLARNDVAAAAGVVRSVLTIYAASVVALAVAGAVGWTVLSERLFVGNDALTAALLLGVAGYGMAYVLRGLLSGCGWFEGYGLLLLGDAGVRLLAAAPLVAVASADLAGVAVAVAGVGGALLPVVFGVRRLRPFLAGGRSDDFRVGRAVAFAAPVTLIAAADQVLVNGGPILVMLGGGGAETAGLVFAATMLVRVPVFLFQGLAASLLPNLTRLNAVDEVARFRRGVVRTSLVLFGIGVAAAAGAAAVGPQTLRGLFGAEFSAGRVELTLLGAGVAFYLVAATVSQALLAANAVRGAAAAWSVSALAFLLGYAALPGDDLLRISESFAAATALAAGALAALLMRRLRRQ
jgi:O-antigen/teichoic acid export membrane protein